LERNPNSFLTYFFGLIRVVSDQALRLYLATSTRIGLKVAVTVIFIHDRAMIFIDTSSLVRKNISLLLGGLSLGAAILLGGCARVPLPGIVFDDGPAPAPKSSLVDSDPIRVLTGARPIRRADPQPEGTANLAAVPPRPEAFLSPIERQALMDRLTKDQTEGNSVGDALRATEAKPQTPTVDIPTLPEAPPPVPQSLPSTSDPSPVVNKEK
jgi:hypothetical protein